MRHDHGNGTSDTTYDLDPNESVIEGIISAVSEYSETDPAPTSGDRSELEPLYHAIDPDALESLFDRSRPEAGQTVVVAFQYMGYEVTVSNDGRISIERPGLPVC